MLTSIRENISGWIAWLIVILISIPFALWGVNSYFEAQSTVVVAEGDGVKITDRQLKDALDRQAEAMRGQFGPQIAAQMVESPEFKAQVLNSLVEKQLLREDVADSGFRLTDTQLKTTIKNTPDFQVNGQFSAERYSRLLASSRSSTSQYENSIRIDGAMNQLRMGYAQSAIVAPARLNRLLALKGQQRDVQYALFTPSMFEDKVQISEQQIRQNYDANSEQYRSPEMVSVDYVVLSVPEMAKAIQPSEERITEYYNENKDQFRSEEQRKASHILIAVSGDANDAWEKAEAKAKDLAGKLKQGADFATLAEQNSDDPGSAKKGGDLGFFGHGVMTPEFEKKVFTMEKGEISEPVKSPFGYHIIRLEEIRPESIKSLNEMRKKVTQAVRRQEAENQFYELAEVLNNTVYEQPDSLQPAAEALNTKVQTSELFSREGGKDLFANPKILEAAFSEQVLNDGVNSDTVEADTETLVALRLNKRQESTVKPFDDVKSSIEKQLKTEKARAMATEQASQMVKSLASGSSWDELVNNNAAEEKKESSLARDKDLGFGGQLTARIFRMHTPVDGKSSVDSIDLAGKAVAVVRLNTVVDGDPANANSVDSSQLKSALTARYGSEFFEAYQTGLHKLSDVEMRMPK